MIVKNILFCIIVMCGLQLQAQTKRIIKSEAKLYCQCYKSFEKKRKRLDRKVIREEKSSNNNSESRLFGGYRLDFSFGECIDKKRNARATKYIKSLNIKEMKKFRRSVKAEIKKRNSNKCNPEYF